MFIISAVELHNIPMYEKTLGFVTSLIVGGLPPKVYFCVRKLSLVFVKYNNYCLLSRVPEYKWLAYLMRVMHLALQS